MLDILGDILEAILRSVFDIEDSKPIKRTWKNFGLICLLCVLVIAIVIGIACMVQKSYVAGIAFAIPAAALLPVWHKLYKKLHD